MMRYGLSSITFLVLVACAQAQDAKLKYPPMPEAFSSFGAAVSDGFVYVYGGHVGQTHVYSTEAVTTKFRRLNLANPKAWEELPADVGIQGLALVAHGGKLYRIGGMQPRNQPTQASDNHSLRTCAMFDPKAGKWMPLPDMPSGRSSHDATVVGDRIYVFGGWQMNGKGKPSDWLDFGVMLDLTKQPLAWQTIKQPFQRRALNVAALDDKIYVIGGMGSDGTTKGVDIYDLKTQGWSKGPELPGMGRNGFTPAACTTGGKLYVSPTDGNLYRLSAKRDAWDEIGALEHKRVVHRIVPAGPDFLLALGGGSRMGNLAQVESLVLSRK